MTRFFEFSQLYNMLADVTDKHNHYFRNMVLFVPVNLRPSRLIKQGNKRDEMGLTKNSIKQIVL